MLAPVCADCVAHQCLLLDGIVRVSKPVKLVPRVFTQSDRRKNSADAGALKRKRDCTQGRQIGQLARDATRYSSGHTEGLSRIRRCFCIRLAERPGLFGKRIQLRLHKLSLNSKNLLKILGLA